MNLLLLIAGLGLILVGADLLTDGAAAVAQRFRMPEFVIGLTVVAIGTSMPELVVSMLSSVEGHSDVAVGNVAGSNLFNTLVIGGLCALIRPMPLSQGNLRRDIPYGMLASGILLFCLSDRLLHLDTADRIQRWEGCAMVALYVALLWHTVRITRRTELAPGGDYHGAASAAASAAARPADRPAGEGKRPMKGWLAAMLILAGLAGLVGGGELFLHHATALARRMGVSESVIAITLMAGGTSLPELASSVVSLVKGRPAMALGNVLGSNMANILLVLGASAAVRPLTPGGITTTDILMVLLSSVMLFASAYTFRRRAIDRWEGAIYLVVYGLYMVWLFHK